MDTTTFDFNLIIEDTENIINDPRVLWCKDNIYSNTSEIKYAIDNDNRLIIYGNIVIPSDYEELPIKIDEVYGSVILSNTETLSSGLFKSLKNFPDTIHGKLDISKNPYIKTLEGCPRIIEGTFWCTNCSLKNFKGISTNIKGSLKAFCNFINNIEALKNCNIEGSIDLYGNDNKLYETPLYKEYVSKGIIKRNNVQLY